MQDLQETHLRLDANLELAIHKNIDLKMRIDKRIQKIFQKKSRIQNAEQMLSGKMQEYEYLKNELGINDKELSEDEDLFDGEYYASKKREKKMKKEIK